MELARKQRIAKSILARGVTGTRMIPVRDVEKGDWVITSLVSGEVVSKEEQGENVFFRLKDEDGVHLPHGLSRAKTEHIGYDEKKSRKPVI